MVQQCKNQQNWPIMTNLHHLSLIAINITTWLGNQNAYTKHITTPCLNLMMTFTQVVDISVTITNDSLAQGYPHWTIWLHNHLIKILLTKVKLIFFTVLQLFKCHHPQHQPRGLNELLLLAVGHSYINFMSFFRSPKNHL